MGIAQMASNPHRVVLHVQHLSPARMAGFKYMNFHIYGFPYILIGVKVGP